MKALLTTVLAVAALAIAGSSVGQEGKPVPKNSVRVFVPGCSKGVLFVATRRTEDQPGTAVPEGTRLRMTGPKALLKEIKAHEGSLVEITGLMRRGQFDEGGIKIGGVRVMPGAPPSAGTRSTPVVSQPIIDVEGWRSIPGECPSR